MINVSIIELCSGDVMDMDCFNWLWNLKDKFRRTHIWVTRKNLTQNSIVRKDGIEVQNILWWRHYYSFMAPLDIPASFLVLFHNCWVQYFIGLDKILFFLGSLCTIIWSLHSFCGCNSHLLRYALLKTIKTSFLINFCLVLLV